MDTAGRRTGLRRPRLRRQPQPATREHLLGFYVIDVPDLDAALEWASRMPAASVGTIEVRAAMSGMAWQRRLD